MNGGPKSVEYIEREMKAKIFKGMVEKVHVITMDPSPWL